MNDKNRRNILILDPERDTAELFTRALETRGNTFKCYWVMTPEEARSLLCEIDFSFVLADIVVLREDHFQLLNTIQETCCKTVVIVDAYLTEKESIKKALELGARSYFIKPVMISSLRKIMEDLSLPVEP